MAKQCSDTSVFVQVKKKIGSEDSGWESGKLQQ